MAFLTQKLICWREKTKLIPDEKILWGLGIQTGIIMRNKYIGLGIQTRIIMRNKYIGLGIQTRIIMRNNYSI